MNDGEIAVLSYDAIAYIKELIAKKKVSSGNELGELLLYIFLERVLNAPKLMSRVEFDNHGGIFTSESAGIHLLTANAACPFNQVILGTSMINGDIQTAIDSAFAHAHKLKNRKKDERRFVESNIFAQSFPDDVYNQLESIILPSESSGKKPSMAFGMFLGYTLSGITSSGKSIDEYQNDVGMQLKSDIINQLPYIESKITQYGLDGYSLYIYLLPFTDADEDKKDIMAKLLQTEGGVA